MKVNRDDILWFLKNIRRKYPEADDTQLADHLASYMEANPRCVNIEGVSHPGRFAYSTVGYGVFSLLGEKYTMGRIEVFDRQDESPEHLLDNFLRKCGFFWLTYNSYEQPLRYRNSVRQLQLGK